MNHVCDVDIACREAFMGFSYCFSCVRVRAVFDARDQRVRWPVGLQYVYVLFAPITMGDAKNDIEKFCNDVNREDCIY